MLPYPVVVVGAGKWGATHAKCWKRLTDARLVAIVDPDIHRAHLLASEYEVSFYSSLHALRMDWGSQKAPLCVLATPQHTFAELHQEGLCWGAAMLVEKPGMGKRLPSYTYAPHSRLEPPVFVGYLERYNTQLHPIREALVSALNQRLPNILIETTRLSNRAPEAPEELVFDLGCHDLDLVLCACEQAGLHLNELFVIEHTFEKNRRGESHLQLTLALSLSDIRAVEALCLTLHLTMGRGIAPRTWKLYTHSDSKQSLMSVEVLPRLPGPLDRQCQAMIDRLSGVASPSVDLLCSLEEGMMRHQALTQLCTQMLTIMPSTKT